MMSVLSTHGLSVRYGGVKALTNVDIAVGAGQVVGLIGPNGAGKTTFVDAVTGFARRSGDVRLAGRSLNGIAPHKLPALGLSRTWQGGELFEDLSVRENLQVADSRRSLWQQVSRALQSNAGQARAEETLALLGISSLAEARPQDLSQGHRKLVGVARALMVRPQIICLDEPAGGLDSAESAALGSAIKSIADGGTACLLIDHDMNLVLSISDRVVVLDFGEVIASGSAEEVRGDRRVVEAYLGSAAAEVTQ
jgi:branched-chain amino acid transport system ATP-binding protein